MNIRTFIKEFCRVLTRLLPAVGVVAALMAGCGNSKSDATAISETNTHAEVQKETKDETERNADDEPDEFESDPILRFDTEKKDYDTDSSGTPLQKVYRRDDDRPVHDDEELASLGIRKYTSQRLIIYTDSAADNIKDIPSIVDQAYDAWVKYFGPPFPSRDGGEFQMTGYIIRDRVLFKKLDLLPDKFDAFIHGKHDGYRFWIMDQETDYYRRHLVIHEATHCFMTISRNFQPVWYLEGMAEFFGVHREDQDGKLTFGVMPQAADEFDGFGRIETIRDELEQGRSLNIKQVMATSWTQFARKKEPYAWSWALCLFLENHPRYRDAFHKLKNEIEAKGFRTAIDQYFTPLKPQIGEEWELFVRDLVPGYDFERAQVEYELRNRVSEDKGKITVSVDASRGWQSTGITVVPNMDYQIQASGETVLSRNPKQWISSADGISIQYAHGAPLGHLQGIVCYRDSAIQGDSSGVSDVLKIGSECTTHFKKSGLLLLRINDLPSELVDNSGKITVVITATTAMR